VYDAVYGVASVSDEIRDGRILSGDLSRQLVEASQDSSRLSQQGVRLLDDPGRLDRIVHRHDLPVLWHEHSVNHCIGIAPAAGWIPHQHDRFLYWRV